MSPARTGQPLRLPRPVLRLRERPLPGGAVLIPLLALAAALGAGVAILAAAGLPAGRALVELTAGTVGDLHGLAEILVRATPLLLCGLAVGLACTLGLWNIGAEGQFLAGAGAATGVALAWPALPGWVLLPLILLAGLLGGGLWALGPALLKARLQVNELLTTLMLNYVALFGVDFLVFGPWQDPVSHGFPLTPLFSQAARLPRLGQTRIHLGLLLGLAAAGGVSLLLRRTAFGFVARAVGANRGAALAAGLPVARAMIVGLLLSGALAGLAGMAEVAGLHHRLQAGQSVGFGYTAIIVAWLGRLNPWGVIAAALGLGALAVGGEILQVSLKIPAHLSLILQGLTLFFVLLGDFIGRYRVRWVREADHG